jgi:hypothetical protein
MFVEVDLALKWRRRVEKNTHDQQTRDSYPSERLGLSLKFGENYQFDDNFGIPGS